MADTAAGGAAREGCRFRAYQPCPGFRRPVGGPLTLDGPAARPSLALAAGGSGQGPFTRRASEGRGHLRVRAGRGQSRAPLASPYVGESDSGHVQYRTVAADCARGALDPLSLPGRAAAATVRRARKGGGVGGGRVCYDSSVRGGGALALLLAAGGARARRGRRSPSKTARGRGELRAQRSAAPARTRGRGL
eukprot:scaffold779_cov355-Prasinococcus_capsulatus_cf.AAC.8